MPQIFFAGMAALGFAALSTSSATLAQTTKPVVASFKHYAGVNSGRFDAATIILQEDGAVWTASAGENVLAFFSADLTTLTRWTMPTDAAPSYLLPEPDGTIWVAQLGGFKISKFDPKTETLTEWPDRQRRPAGLVKRPDGKLWLTETNGTLTLFDPATGTLTYHSGSGIFSLSYPFQDDDGSIWAADFLAGYGALVRFAPDGTKATRWELPDTYTLPSKIFKGFDGYIWASFFQSGHLARFDPVTYEMKVFTLGPDTIPFSMANYKDRIVYSDQSTGLIGFLDPGASTPISTSTLTPVEITITTVQETVTPSTTVLKSTVTNVLPTSVELSTGAQYTAVTEYPAGIGEVYGIAVDEPRNRIVFSTRSNIGELLPPIPASDNDLYFPSAASASGAMSSLWQTQVYLWNKGTADSTGATKALAPAERLIPNGWIAGFAPTAFPSIPAGQILLQEDPIGNEMGGAGSFGALRFTPDTNAADLFAGIRVQNKRGDGGTVGFYKNPVKATAGIGAGETAFVFAAINPETERTNAGFFVLEAATGTVSVAGAEGTTRASMSFKWPAGTHIQYSTVFSKLGIPPLPSARIVFSVTSGKILPFGTSTDNVSSDPADLTVFSQKNAVPFINILAASYREGPLGLNARTDLQLYSASGDTQVTLRFRPAVLFDAPEAPPFSEPLTISVPDGKVVTVEDVLAKIPGVLPGVGEIEVISDQPIWIFSRVTGGEASTGRYGFGLPGLNPNDTIPENSKGVFIAATDNGWFVMESDLYLTNLSFDPVTVLVNGISDLGVASGSREVTLGPRETRYIPAAYYSITAIGGPTGRLDVIPQGTAPKVFATLLRNDRKTGDTDAVLPLMTGR